MIDRAYIWVDGPTGVGKTMLVERFLQSNRSRLVMAARLVETDQVKQPSEDRPGDGDPDRYERAGAFHSIRYRYPPGEQGRAAGDFFRTSFIEQYSEGIIFEGRSLTDLEADLFLFVTRPLPEGEDLVEMRSREEARIGLRTYLALASGGSPDELDEGPPDEDLELDMEDGEVIEEIEIPDEVGRKLLEWAEKGVPVTREVWTLRDDHQGLARAGLVVVNIHDESERSAAERLAAQIRRIREDKQISEDVLGWNSRRRLKSIHIANLADRRDLELKKVVAKIKRRF